MVRNPLASPDILGVSAGGAVGAVFCIVVIGAGATAVTTSALVGAIATIAVIYLLAIKKGLSSYRLVLIGIGITAMLEAGVAYLLTRANLYDAQRATVWLTGSLNGRGWEYVRPLIHRAGRAGAPHDDQHPPAARARARRRRRRRAGRRPAPLQAGPRPQPAPALAAVATAAAGPVGFVALIAPQIARRLVRRARRRHRPAGLVGAAIVVFGDLVARRVFSPTELPVGVVTAIVGAPYLLWLLARANRIGSGG